MWMQELARIFQNSLLCVQAQKILDTQTMRSFLDVEDTIFADKVQFSEEDGLREWKKEQYVYQSVPAVSWANWDPNSLKYNPSPKFTPSLPLIIYTCVLQFGSCPFLGFVGFGWVVGPCTREENTHRATSPTLNSPPLFFERGDRHLFLAYNFYVFNLVFKKWLDLLVSTPAPGFYFLFFTSLLKFNRILLRKPGPRHLVLRW